MPCCCRFILQDLAAVDRGVTPWVVVNMHRPIYTSSTVGVGPSSVIRVAEDLRAALEPIFMLYQVRMHPHMRMDSPDAPRVRP